MIAERIAVLAVAGNSTTIFNQLPCLKVVNFASAVDAVGVDGFLSDDNSAEGHLEVLKFEFVGDNLKIKDARHESAR